MGKNEKEIGVIMKDTDFEEFTKQRLDELVGRCLICADLEINGGGEEPEWNICTNEFRDDIEIWDEAWGQTKPCPFFVTDLTYCPEHKTISTKFMNCYACWEEHYKDLLTPSKSESGGD